MHDEIFDLTALEAVAKNVADNSIYYDHTGHFAACIWPVCGARVYSDSPVYDVPHVSACPVLFACSALDMSSISHKAADEAKGDE